MPIPALEANAGAEPRCEIYYPADGAIITVVHHADAYEIPVESQAELEGMRRGSLASSRPALPAAGDVLAAASAHAAKLGEEAAVAGFEEHPPLSRATVAQRNWSLAVTRRMTKRAAFELAMLKVGSAKKKPTFAQKTVFFENEEYDPPFLLGDVEVLLAFGADNSTMRVHLEGAEGKSQVWLTHGGADGRITSIGADGEVRQRWVRPTLPPVLNRAELASSRSLEFARTVLPNGTVLSHLEDGSTSMLLRDGNTAVRYANGCMDITNSEGVRVRRTPPLNPPAPQREEQLGPKAPPASELSFLPSVVTAALQDRDTDTRMLARSDCVSIAILSDGRKIVSHADGTNVLATADVEAFHGARGEITVEGGPSAAGPACGRAWLNLRTDEQTVSCGGGTVLRRCYDADSALMLLVAKRPDGATLVVHAHATKRRELTPFCRFSPAEVALTERLPYDDEATYEVKLATGELSTKDVDGSIFRIKVGRPSESSCVPAPVDDYQEGDDPQAVAERQSAALDIVAAGARAREAGERPPPRPMLPRARATMATGGTHPPRLFCFRPDGSCLEWLRPNDVAPYIAAVGASYAFPSFPPLEAGALEVSMAEPGTVVVAHPVSAAPPSAYVTILSQDLDELAVVEPSRIVRPDVAHLFDFNAAYRTQLQLAQTIYFRQFLFTTPLDDSAREAFVQVVRAHLQSSADSLNQLRALRLTETRSDYLISLERRLASSVESREAEMAKEAAAAAAAEALRAARPPRKSNSRNSRKGFAFNTLNNSTRSFA